MPETTKPNLSGVSETLLITLYIRATESQRPDALIKDERAEALVCQLDRESLRKTLALTDDFSRLVMILKSREFDRFAQDFLRRHPDAVVVHIGCGLDTCFERVAGRNSQVEWYDLDLPDVIELRRKLVGGEDISYLSLPAWEGSSEGDGTMMAETIFRIAFLVLLLALIGMRVYFMIKVRRSGGRLMPDEAAVKREGGRVVLAVRVTLFFALTAFLLMYLLGAKWIDAFRFPLPAWLRWAGFAIGILSVLFWTWTQVTLDTQWSAQLQLTKDHSLVTTGPYARVRHPLYSAMFGWGIALALLTANWIFTAICVLMVIGLLWRVPKEEQMMLESFGDEYKAYMQHTGRFFPKLGSRKATRGVFHA